MQCKICGKTPRQLDEYIDTADAEGVTPEELVRESEGTYNPGTDLFYCTDCYIKIGMPRGTA